MGWGDPKLIEPFGDFVLVETIDEEETRGGVIIPQATAEARPERATVLAVGPGARHPKSGERIPLDVEVGDEIIFNRRGGIHVGGFDDHFILFQMKDILARFRRDDETRLEEVA